MTRVGPKFAIEKEIVLGDEVLDGPVSNLAQAHPKATKLDLRVVPEEAEYSAQSTLYH